MAMFYGGLLSAILARHVFLPLARQSPNAIVAATLGVSLVLMEAARIAADTRDFWLPPLLPQPLVFASDGGFHVTLTLMQAVNCTIALIAIVSASLWLARGRFGREWRAVSDDPTAAALCAVDTTKVFRAAVVLGGLAAALAGILAALYYGNLGFGAGLVFGLKVLFITAIGGYLSPPRAAAGAAAFGIAESLWSGYFPIEWRDAWMLGLLAAMLVLRPAQPLPART
jgi:branched-chain amino acid transport system permease protein